MDEKFKEIVEQVSGNKTEDLVKFKKQMDEVMI
jgi:hypothetical protein